MRLIYIYSSSICPWILYGLCGIYSQTKDVCKIDVFIYFIDILLAQAWKTACSVQFTFAQSLQRCSKVNYQNPGICVSSQAAVAPHPKTVTGLLNHLQPYGRWIIGAACAVMGFHYEDESDLYTGSQVWNCLLLSEDLTGKLCKYDWRLPLFLAWMWATAEIIAFR